MPASSWLIFKRDQFLDSTTFVTLTKYPKAFTFFLYSYFLFYYIISVKKHPKISLSCAGLFFCSLYGTALWLRKLKSLWTVILKPIYVLRKNIKANHFLSAIGILIAFCSWLCQSITVKCLYYSSQNGSHLFIGNLSQL